MPEQIQEALNSDLVRYNKYIEQMNPLEIIEWAYNTFKNKFAFTTSFGIQSSVLLHIIQKSSLKNKVKIFWIDTGYLPKETYNYADEIINKLSLNIEVLQSELSPARMEALYGKLWESNKSEDLDRYHKIRKINPLEKAFKQYSINCWASGVRAQQTENRSKMKVLDIIRDRYSLRPLLKWSSKDMFYYMEENNLPQHPMFLKGYSTIGDWHSSKPETQNNQGRITRFGGIKEECGLHIND
tara:strand:- start:29079 stop:29801 length:723 start_codon:yes stop_codon:yes gene_type:complete